MKIYNSLTNRKDNFQTLKPNTLTMYVCGPTVYNYIHIGNARPVVFFDVVRRYFNYLGYHVNYVSNLTDVDDRIILEASRLGITEKELTEAFIQAFKEDTKALNSLFPNDMPKATNYIKEMIEYIQTLIDTGYAYQGSDAVYFRVSNVEDYGKLSNQTIENLNIGARIEENLDKESPVDFVLWKKTTVGLNFDSPWGKGRPGWHTECAVMNRSIFEGMIDIHGGGSDLLFPHHENEMAQSEARCGHSLAKTWMHVGRLDMDNEKMSKSLGNIVLVRDLLKKYPYQSFRLMMLSHHYRQPINYSDDLMNQFHTDWERISRALKSTFIEMNVSYYEHIEYNDEAILRFKEAMDDDFNCANALTVVYDQIKAMNRTKVLEEKAMFYYTILLMLNVLGIDVSFKRLSQEQIEAYLEWQIARSEKRYQDADQIRIRLVEAGIL